MAYDLPAIFCPTCGELVLAQASCATCGWRRPLTDVGIGATVWRTDLGQRLAKEHGYPVLAGGTYCSGTEDGLVLALDHLSGQIVWEVALGPGRLAPALASDGARLFVGGQDGRPLPQPGQELLALAVATGAVEWRYASQGHSLSAATVAAGVVFATSVDGWLHAVDATTGHRRWAVMQPTWGPAAPAVADGIVCVGGRGNVLSAYATADGARLWQHVRPAADHWFAEPLTLAAGRLFALCWDGTLSAVAADSGQVLWQQPAERGRGYTTAPVATGARVFIGGRVRPSPEDGSAYAILALNAAQGTELWRYHSPRPFRAPLLAAADVILAVASDGTLVVLEAATGAVRWQTTGEWEPVSQPLVAGDVVYLGERAGTVHALRWRVSPLTALPSAEVLQRQGDRAGEAVARALAGDLVAAAELYATALAQPTAAARLYEQAGEPGRAAPLWEAAGELNRARLAHQAAGDRLGLARIAERLHEPLAAAQRYEEAGQPIAAARLYEQAGDRGRSAQLYGAAGQAEEAGRLWAALGQWEQLVDSLLVLDRPAAAARILHEHGQLERAARLYEEAGELTPALALRTELGHWERVAALALQCGAFEQAATAHEHLGQPRLAAQAYEEAAQRAEAATAVAPDHITHLYAQAIRTYAAVFETAGVQRCQVHIRRLRRMPEIDIEAIAQAPFREHEWNTLSLNIANTGYGPALNVTIAIQGRFEAETSYQLASLLPDQPQTLAIILRPQRDEVGPKVPLTLAVAFDDAHGQRAEISRRLTVPVVQRDDAAAARTPPRFRLTSRMPGASPVPAPPADGADAVVLTLRLMPQPGGATILWEADVLGGRRSHFATPFPDATLPLVMKALDAAQWGDDTYSAPRFSPAEEEQLIALGLWRAGWVVADVSAHIGRALHAALTADPEGATALRTVRDHATAIGRPLTIFWRFPANAVELAALPWELVQDGGGALLLSRARGADCVRFLDLDQALPPVTRRQPGSLRILAIVPHALLSDTVRQAEHAARHAAWADLVTAGQVVVEEISPATPAAVNDRLQAGPPVDIIHFFGHGRYLDGQGALLLDEPGGGQQWVTADRIATALSTSRARLVILHACRSATSSEAGLLTGVAPALSAAGVPAVVAMQLTVRITSATRFAAVVYRALAQGVSIPRAVSQARQALYVEESDGASWYVPTLTMRGRSGDAVPGTGILSLLTPDSHR